MSRIDPRGQQLAAAITSALLVAVLLTAPGPVAVALLLLQLVVFGTAVLRGVQRTPVAALFRTLVLPRLSAPGYLEDAAPPRFAQGVGLGFVAVALTGLMTGADAVGYVAAAFALVAALLNATIGLCLGCEANLLGRRAHARLRTIPTTTTTTTTIPATGSRSTP
jgi:hypothetical protein